MTIKLLSTGGIKDLEVGEIYTMKKIGARDVISCNGRKIDLKLHDIEYLRRG